MPPNSARIIKPVILHGRELAVPYRTPVGEIFRQNLAPQMPILAAIVQHRCVNLNYPICTPTEIVPVDYSMREGVLVYRRTASLILLEALRQLYPGAHVTIGQSLGNGYIYEFRDDRTLGAAECDAIEQRMRNIVKQDLPLRTESVSVDEARELFRTMGFDDKVRLLKTWWEPFVPLVRCGEFFDIHYYPVAPSTGHARFFDIGPAPDGLILRFPARGRLAPVRPYRYEENPKLYQVYRETRQWNEILNVSDVGQLNELTVKGHAGDLIRVAEALHEKKIAQIADHICQADGVKLVTIAGPSSSGKTTFSKRLSLQLVVNGIRTIALSADNFYIDRSKTPLDSEGRPDFEAIEAIDLQLFNEVLEKLMRGQEVLTPEYDFTTGQRKPMSEWVPMKLGMGQVLVVEGIHGLNERLTESVSNKEKYRIYVSALTQLCIDDHNRIFTSDTRYLRRIIRDRRFRGYSAAATIESWPRVRRGEMRNIFPFQEQADIMFNSALVYEQAVLRLYAERFLLEVPQDHPSFVDAYRLLKFVQHFVPMFDESVPQTSILREFIGGSAFKY